MVHALESIHTLLQPDGWLIDLHPSFVPVGVYVQSGTASTLVGTVEEDDDYIEYRQAEQALSQVVQDGLFRLEKRALFRFQTIAGSLEELLAYFEKSWTDAILSTDTRQNISTALADYGSGAEIILKEPVWISRLAPG